MKRFTFPLFIAGLCLVAAAMVFMLDPAAAAGASAFGLVMAEAGAASTDDLKKLSTEFKQVGDDLKKFAEDAQKEIKQHGAMTAETKDSVDKLLVKSTELDGRIKEIEQKLVRRGSEGGDRVKSVGELVVDNDQVKSMLDRKSGTVRVSVKAITSDAESAGALVAPQRLPGIIAPPQRRMTVRDLLTPGRTSSSALEYVREAGFTNAAAPVAEGNQKPQSGITFEQDTANVRTIAHWVHATKQILDDAPMLQSYIDGRLRYGLMFVEEGQLLKGAGTGQNLHGIVPQAVAFDPAFVPAHATIIDTLRLALLQAELAEYPATGITLHPTDWARIELTKDNEGRYIFANPNQLLGPALWGKPVVPTQAMDESEFLVGAFQLGAQIFDREDANVEISTEDRDNFVKNMVTIRAEERLALAVYRPEAFVTGELVPVEAVEPEEPEG